MCGHRTEPRTQAQIVEHDADAPTEPRAGATRWTRICAWDGHELGAIGHVQVSAHERVCRFHQAQFEKWCQDTSRRRYRAEGEPANTGEVHPQPALS